jgi:hypothetical protein
MYIKTVLTDFTAVDLHTKNDVLDIVDSVNHLLFHGFGNPFLIIIGYFLNDLVHLIAQRLDLFVPCWQYFSC